MIKILKFIFRRYWQEASWTIIFVISVTMIGATASIAAPYLFSCAIDGLTRDADRAVVLNNLILYGIIFGCAKIFSYAARYMTFLCAEHLSFIANTSFFGRLLHKTPDFFLDHNAAEIGSARQQGTQTLNTITQLGLGGILPGCIQIFISIILLGRLISWDIALIVFVYGAVVIFLDFARIGRVQPSLKAAISRSQDNAHLIGNAIAVIDTLRQTRGERWITARFTSTALETLANWRRYVWLSSAFCVAIGVAAALQLSITFLVLFPRYESGSISIGAIVLFNTLLIQLNEPFHLTGIAIKEMVEAAARFRPIASMWMAPEAQEPTEPAPYHPTLGILEFEDVAFRYRNGRGVSNVSFVAGRGTPTFLTGETGSGKSTLLRLILKGLQPSKGRILADGTDIAYVTTDNWFAHVGVVPQEVALLNDTLLVNIVLGRSFNADRLRQAAAQASILSRIEAMPEGFETMVGERGLKLSGGERQRVAIARALYGEPAILILDEASSALDDETERQIMDGLRNLADHLTIVAVTHRSSMIRPNDQVIHLRNFS